MSDGTVHERVARVMAALNYIPKGTSPGVNYEFRGIDAVFNHLHKLLADEGLYLQPKVQDDWQVQGIPGSPDRNGNPRTQYQATFRVRVDVEAADGTSTTLGTGLCQSHDYGDKAVYQAQQNGVKYVLLEAFAIPTAEQDMDARHPDESPRFELGEFIRQEVQQFTKWDDDRRRLEWNEALEGLTVKTEQDARVILGRMRAIYEAENPPELDGQEALPVES